MVPPQSSPYGSVVVRGLVWEGHDHYREYGLVHNADQELQMVMGAFESYGYDARVKQIPKDPGMRSGFPHYLHNRLDSFVSPLRSTLIILYYQGHGTLDRHGHLILSNGNGQWMHWSNIANAIVDVRCDVLTILNCCHAGAAIRERIRLRPNYEQHLKQVITAVPHNIRTGWGFANGFAACLEQALREHHYNWESSFRGVPRHWAEAINRIMVRKQGGLARVGVDHLVKPPRNAAERPIVVGPRAVC